MADMDPAPPRVERPLHCPLPMDARDRMEFARRCEDLAEEYLRGRGCVILARNWRARAGEIDIVARDGRELVFVEVKGKRGLGWGRPEEMVGRRKAGKIIGAALAWMADNPGAGGSCRFDVVAIVASPSGGEHLEHLVGVFGPGDAAGEGGCSRGW